MEMNKTIFIDRDGVAIEDKGYLDNVEGVELMPGFADALKTFRERGFKLVIITNQSGIGRGKFNAEVVEQQHARITELLKEFRVTIDLFKVCPHAPEDECDCRKPNTLLFEEAGQELLIDFEKSWMIGDKPSEIQAGKQMGCRSILFNGETHCDADFFTENWPDTAQVISILDR